MKPFIKPGVLWFVFLMGAAPCFSQEANEDLKKEIEALKQGQAAIQKELAEIKALLASRAAPARPAGPSVKGIVFDIGDNPVEGDEAAPLTLIEFTDYQCGFCGRHERETAPLIEREFIDRGKLRLAVLDLPLTMHKLAFKAALASHCAGEQGKQWEMHHRLFENQQALEPWRAHAEAIGLDGDEFQACLDSGKYAGTVNRDMAEAKKAGASGTPSFVLGTTDPDDPNKVVGLTFIRGAQPFAAFKSQIEQALAQLEN